MAPRKEESGAAAAPAKRSTQNILQAAFDEARVEVDEVNSRLEPLREERDVLLREAEQIRLKAAELTPEIRRLEAEELAPVRETLSRLATALGARALSDAP